MIKKQNNGFTLTETLVTLCLLLLFFGMSVVCLNSMAFNQEIIKVKVDDYVSLNKFVKYDAELNGKKTVVMIISNKLEVAMENQDGSLTNILSLRDQVENVNNSTIFGCNSTNAIVYLPNGEVEQSEPVTILIDGNTNSVVVSIEEFDRMSITYTNQVDMSITNVDLQLQF